MRLAQSTIAALEGFVTDTLPASEFDAFLVAAVDDFALSSVERSALLSLRMTAIECGEGDAALEQLRREALDLLSSSETVVATTNNGGFLTLMPAAAPILA